MTTRKLLKIETQTVVGLVLFILAFLLGLKFRFWGTFIDEGDNFSVGLLMSQGEILYKDIFSHHFPFPYFWVMAVIKIFGASVSALRISLLIFVMGALGWAMWLTKRYFVFGATSLFWILLGHFYAGNNIMYSVFSGISLTVVISIVLFAQLDRKKLSNGAVITISLFSAIAILSDPLSIYAVGITALALLWQERRDGIKYVAFMAGWGIVFIIYLVVTRSVADFVQNAIQFNSNVYINYFPANPLRIKDIAKLLVTLLGIAAPGYRNPDLWYPLKTIFPDGIDAWIFTGFLFRLSVIVATIAFLLKREWMTAGYLYLVAASLAAISPNGFRFIPFVLLSLLMLSVLISGFLKRRVSEKQPEANLWQLWGRRLWLPVQAMTLLMFAWLLFRSVDFAWKHADAMNYTAAFGKKVQRGEEVNAWACGYPDAKLGYYPGDPYVYYFSRMQPVSKYLFMFPWVADVGLNNVITELEQTPAIIYFTDLEHSQIWGHPEKEFLAPLISTVQEKYRRFGMDVYVHSEIFDTCVAGYRLAADLLLADVQIINADKNRVTVDLTWNGSPSVYDEKRSNFYTAYVQVVDENLSRIAGSDIQIDPNNIQVMDETGFKQRFEISLPADVPVGTYGLKIGIYFFENGNLVDISSVHQPGRVQLN